MRNRTNELSKVAKKFAFLYTNNELREKLIKKSHIQQHQKIKYFEFKQGDERYTQ